MTTIFQQPLRFDGAAYLGFRDDERLTGQLRRIWDVVKDERWHTLAEIAGRTGDHEASISAQLRHLRKPRFGAHTLEREYVDNGLFRYRLVINPDAAQVMAAAPKRARKLVPA